MLGTEASACLRLWPFLHRVHAAMCSSAQRSRPWECSHPVTAAGLSHSWLPPVCAAGMDVLAPTGARPEAEHDAAAAAAAEVGGAVYGMPEQVAAAHLVAQMQQGGSPVDRAGSDARTLSDAPLVRCRAVQRAHSLKGGGAYAGTVGA